MKSCLTVILVWFTLCSLMAQDHQSRNKSFLDPDMDVSRYTQMFESDNREVFALRDEIVAAMELKPGSALADVGAGTGAFLQPFVKALGENGHVYAVDISPKFAEHMRNRIDEEKLANVTVVLNTFNSITLPANSLDVIFMCDTYHHIDHPGPTLASMLKALKKGGKVFIVDFDRDPKKSSEWILGHVRASKAEFRAEVEQAGFRFDREVQVSDLKENFFMQFHKP